MILTKPMPFREAERFVRGKQLMPTALSSAQLRRLDADLRRRAVFSARMTELDFLGDVQRLTRDIAAGLQDRAGRYVSIPEAKAQLRERLEAKGYSADPEERGTVKDFKSDFRRQLIMETNVLDTLGYGRWKAEQDSVALDVNPGWELVRLSEANKPRDWAARWAAAGEAVQWQGALPDRWIALKTSPIWNALGAGAGGYGDTLGNPWPPFAFQSGMGVIEVSRRMAEDLGLLGENDTVRPDSDTALNDGLEASLSRFDEELRELVQKDPDLLVDQESVSLPPQPTALPATTYEEAVDRLRLLEQEEMDAQAWLDQVTAKRWEDRGPTEYSEARERLDLARERQREAISIAPAERGTVQYIGTVHAARKKQVAAGAAIVERYVHADLMPEVGVRTKAGRAHYDPTDHTIYITSRNDGSVVAHEMVHDIEFRHPEVLRETKQFLEDRAQGETPRLLRHLTGSSSYAYHEIAYEDEWEQRGGRHYTGRIYPDATEILTMGIQRLDDAPAKFLREDPDYFEFVLRTLRKW